MIQRCLNPRCREHPYYGGRGIRVCDRWLEAQGFPNFLADVGPQPFKRASVHRLNNDGHYEPGNVVWASQEVQMRNTRVNRVLTHDGRSMVLVAWADELRIKKVTLAQRLFKGWTVERALTTPVKHRRPYSEWAKRSPRGRRQGAPDGVSEEGPDNG
jgi:hypothetical protein